MGERHKLFKAWVWKWLESLLGKLSIILSNSKYINVILSSLQRPGTWKMRGQEENNVSSLNKYSQWPREVPSITTIFLVFPFSLLTTRDGKRICNLGKYVWQPFFRGLVSRELRSHYLSMEGLKLEAVCKWLTLKLLWRFKSSAQQQTRIHPWKIWGTNKYLIIWMISLILKITKWKVSYLCFATLSR